jgi:DNA-directed RNA polymerase specialized sigma24 family protein
LAASALQIPLEEIPAEDIADDSIDREELQTALGELPDEYRLVVLMFYFEELSYKEIAEQLEIPIGTVMSRLSRAKGHLRARLACELDGPSAASSPLSIKSNRADSRPAPAENERRLKRAT